MNNPFEDQRRFMEACGQTANANNDRQQAAYLSMIREEDKEFDDALLNEQTLSMGAGIAEEAQVADAIIDSIVVRIGYGLSRGWPMQRLWDAAMGANLAKIDLETGKVIRREDGKILKPEGWQPPNLEAVLIDHKKSGDYIPF